MRRLVSIATIPFLAPLILFSHAAYIDGSRYYSIPAITLASVVPVLFILLYTRSREDREMREELTARRIFMIVIGIGIISLSKPYRDLGMGTLSKVSIIYGLGTLIAGIFTLLGHKTSVHVMARSVSGFIELLLEPLLGILMIGVSILSGISRLKVRAHTKSQVLTGFLIGPLSLGIIIFIRHLFSFRIQDSFEPGWPSQVKAQAWRACGAPPRPGSNPGPGATE